MEPLNDEDSLEPHINQTGITFGLGKFALMKKALELRGTPALGTQDVPNPTAYVKFFNPSGVGVWYITEYDGRHTCFGWAEITDGELGYIDLHELSEVEGPLGIGIEVDVHFKPTKLHTNISRTHFL